MLGRLMAPLVSALSGNEALVTLSIRTLEYWVDSLNPEFLEPAMLPVIPQLMRALWSHLRPLPYNFSAKVRPRILSLQLELRWFGTPLLALHTLRPVLSVPGLCCGWTRQKLQIMLS